MKNVRSNKNGKETSIVYREDYLSQQESQESSQSRAKEFNKNKISLAILSDRDDQLRFSIHTVFTLIFHYAKSHYSAVRALMV